MSSEKMHLDCPQCGGENLRGCPVCWKCGYPLIRSERRQLSVEYLEELLAEARLVDATPDKKPGFWKRLLPQRARERRWGRSLS